MQQSGFHMSSNGVDQQGLGKAAAIYWNLRPSEIYEMALARGEGEIAASGPLLVKPALIRGARRKINLSFAMPRQKTIFGGTIINP